MKNVLKLTALITIGWVTSKVLKGLIKESIEEEIKVLQELKRNL